MTDVPYEKTPHGALSRLFDKVIVVCQTCHNQMRFLGEWPVQFPASTDPTKPIIHQALRWNCGTCRVPSDAYERGLPMYACILMDGPLLELGRKLAEEN